MLYGMTAIMGIAAVLFSRGLYVEMSGLTAITFMYIYIFLTDSHHMLPQIREKSDDEPNEDDREEK